MEEVYNEKQWEEEMKSPGIMIHFSSGMKFSFGSSLPCPQCETVGFYGPRISYSSNGTVERKYRACKFCGFWQEVSGGIFKERPETANPYRCIAVYCEKCGKDGEIFGFNWRLPWTDGPGCCPDCKTERRDIKWASDDLNHPYQKLKEQIIKMTK